MPSASRPLRNNSAETEAPTASVRWIVAPGTPFSSAVRTRATAAWVACFAGLGAEPDQHLGRVAEALHALVGDVLGAQRGADLGEIGRALGADLHHHAAREVDAQVQAGVEEQDDRRRGQDRRDDQAHEPAPHEVDAGVVGNQAEAGFDEHWRDPQTGSSFGRVAIYQRETSSRVSIQAVNSEVAMPTVIVTAKPRTGPEPKTNSMTCARKAVALLSKIVL